MLRSRLYALSNDSTITHHADVNYSPPACVNEDILDGEVYSNRVRAKPQQNNWTYQNGPSTAADCCGGVETEAHSDKATAHFYERERDRMPEEVGSLHSSPSSENQDRSTSTSGLSKHESSYWARWMEDFTQNYKVS